MNEKHQTSDTIDLHLYAQAQWHDDAYLVGNRGGLTALRDALTRLLDGSASKETVLAYTNDGEGYDLTVHLVTPEVFGALTVPYTDPIAIAASGNERHPSQLE
jgi:hypothetical protein